MFLIVGAIIFVGAWILTPLLASDCLSRERREGTLGLLFLTPLRPIEIVIGKGLIHFLRATSLVVATIPVLTIPFLLGGVTGLDLLMMLCLYGTALFMSLASGILASSFCRSSLRSVVLTGAWLVILVYLFSYLPLAIPLEGYDAIFDIEEGLEEIFELFFFRGTMIRPTVRATLLTPTQWAVCSLVVSMLVFTSVIVFAARRLKATWQDKPPTTAQIRIQKVFVRPRFFTRLLQWSNRRQLTRNPVGWLQQYSWQARLIKWGWCLLIVVVCSLATRNVDDWLEMLKVFVMLSMAFCAVSSFQREKETGALELLLVTPLRERQIILGRLGGVWSQFFPAFLLSTALWLYMESALMRGYNREASILMSLLRDTLNFAFMPVVGLYYAMRMKNVVAAWLVTCGLWWVLPAVLGWGLTWIGRKIFGYGLYSIVSNYYLTSRITEFIFLTGIAVLAACRLHRWLKQRSFALGR